MIIADTDVHTHGEPYHSPKVAVKINVGQLSWKTITEVFNNTANTFSMGCFNLF